MYKSTISIANKNVVYDYQSKSMTWEKIGLSEELIEALEDMKMDKPSIIQSHSIPKILADR